MTTPSRWLVPLLVLSALAGGCSDKQETAPNPQATSPSTTQPPECDMSGMDMSNVSAEAHQKMLDDCDRAKARNR